MTSWNFCALKGMLQARKSGYSTKSSFLMVTSLQLLLLLLQKKMPAPKILRYTHISDVFIVAIMALVVKFYSFNDGLFVGTLLAMTMFTIRYSGSQAGVRSCGDARHFDINFKA